MASNALLDRYFSTMLQVKNDWRNRLNTDIVLCLPHSNKMGRPQARYCRGKGTSKGYYCTIFSDIHRIGARPTGSPSKSKPKPSTSIAASAEPDYEFDNDIDNDSDCQSRDRDVNDNE